MAKNRPNPAEQDRRRQARAAALQAAAAAKRRRTLTQVGVVAGVAVVVVAIIATAVVLGTRGSTPAAGAAAPVQDTSVTVGGARVPLAVDGTAVRVGPADAKATVDLWVDYSCPHCQEFEAANNDVLDGLVAKGGVAVKYHNIQIVTDYGTQAGSASACVAVNDPDRWVAFNAALYANHSATTDGWGAADFRRFAADQGAGSATQDCISAEHYMGWIASNTSASDDAGVKGTPTMFLNGQQQSDVPSGDALVAKVNVLVAAS